VAHSILVIVYSMLKHGTRFEKLAVNFHGMLQLAMIRRYFRLLFSDSA